ncbi:hypothetical protein PACILC2_36170 [Paenibacillus cisolokensis]|uniref:Amine oxidase domain-containing protein n=1 Tax=Paenibacillus cisolokensis TaxID=1658519 RepID=A0ABQ4N9Y0_9BACL|nr:oleate hydratase [Paenibacillus cisolokensis]GIQ65049.1 hypothetical protein PACILC2_36170 [Paenibacillus cisolokensis]
MSGTGPDRIVVIGGGISGLSSAFYLLREAEKRGQSVKVTLVEAAGRLGGKIETLHRDGFVIEKGPDSFLARKTAMIELARELGIADELTGTNPAAQKRIFCTAERSTRSRKEWCSACRRTSRRC